MANVAPRVGVQPDAGPMVRLKYKGPHGQGKDPALVIGVGEVFYGESREFTVAKAATLNDKEWEEAHQFCQYRKPDGELCDEPKAEGEELCGWHLTIVAKTREAALGTTHEGPLMDSQEGQET